VGRLVGGRGPTRGATKEMNVLVLTSNWSSLGQM
jgi:hypothetical protein